MGYFFQIVWPPQHTAQRCGLAVSFPVDLLLAKHTSVYCAKVQKYEQGKMGLICDANNLVEYY